MDAEAIACDVETGRDREKLALRRRGKDDASTGRRDRRTLGRQRLKQKKRVGRQLLGSYNDNGWA